MNNKHSHPVAASTIIAEKQTNTYYYLVCKGHKCVRSRPPLPGLLAMPPTMIPKSI